MFTFGKQHSCLKEPKLSSESDALSKEVYQNASHLLGARLYQGRANWAQTLKTRSLRIFLSFASLLLQVDPARTAHPSSDFQA